MNDCKELGLLKVGDVTARSYFFDLGIQWSDLTEKDKRSCAYVIKHIHKLRFGVPEGVRAYELLALGEIIATFYCRVKRNERSIVASKGGHFEKDLLASLDIPSVNLECFGCPKAGDLMCDLGWLETCGKSMWWRTRNCIVPKSRWKRLVAGWRSCKYYNKKVLLRTIQI